MATRLVKLSELKGPDLKRELEERDLETFGIKSQLQQRLREVIIADGGDPDCPMFETGSSEIRMLSEKIDQYYKQLEDQIQQSFKPLEDKIQQSSVNLKSDIQQDKLQETATNLENVNSQLESGTKRIDQLESMRNQQDNKEPPMYPSLVKMHDADEREPEGQTPVTLDHVVSGEAVSVDTNKITAVQDWPVPRSKRDVRSYPGFCTLYQK